MNIGMVQSAAAMAGLERWQAAVSHNLAAAQVAGYKPLQTSFASVLKGQLPGSTQLGNLAEPEKSRIPEYSQERDYRPGRLRSTDNPNDLAITGEGFFSVQTPEGDTFYTRNGEFHVSADNYIVNSSGMRLMGDGGPLQTVASGGPIKVTGTGRVSQNGAPVGQLALTKFDRPGDLIANGGLFKVNADKDPGAQPVENIQLAQGFVEDSGVESVREMVNLITISRAYETQQKVLQTYDQRLEKSIQAFGETR